MEVKVVEVSYLIEKKETIRQYLTKSCCRIFSSGVSFDRRLLKNSKSATYTAGSTISSGCNSNHDRDIVLSNATLSFLPGSVTAFMGYGDGCRKLLECIALYQTSLGYMSGSIEYDSTTRSSGVFKDIAYISSKCYEKPHFDSLTVFEYLFYSARLRCTHGIIECRERSRVAIKLIDIDGTTRVGNLSDCELRLLSIGEELVGNPTLLCLNNPTVGLDSSSALKVIQTLHKLSKRVSSPTTVIYIVDTVVEDTMRYMDNIAVFNESELLFTACLSVYTSNVKAKVVDLISATSMRIAGILSSDSQKSDDYLASSIRNGFKTHAGSTNQQQQRRSISITLQKAYFNFMEIVNVSVKDQVKVPDTPLGSASKTWKTKYTPNTTPMSPAGDLVRIGTDTEWNSIEDKDKIDVSYNLSEYNRKSTNEFMSLNRRLGALGIPARQKKPFWKDVWILTSRSLKYHYKNRVTLQMTFFRFLIAGAVVGLLAFNDGKYLNMNTTSNDAVYSDYDDDLLDASVYNVTSSLFFVIAINMAGASFAIPHMHANVNLLRKEARAGLHSASSSVISVIVVEWPISILAAMFIGVVVRSMLALSGNPSSYYSAVILATLSGYSLASLMAVYCRTIRFASFSFAFLGAFSLIFTGYQMHIPDLPGLWPWASSLVFSRWAFECLMVSCFSSKDGGEEYLRIYGFDSQSTSYCITWLISWLIIVYFVVAVGISAPSYRMIYLDKDKHATRVIDGPVGSSGDVVGDVHTIDASDETATPTDSPSVTHNTKRNSFLGITSPVSVEASAAAAKFQIVGIKESHQVTLSFEKLKYVASDDEVIVSGISGTIKPGSSCCIIDGGSYSSHTEGSAHILLQMLSGKYRSLGKSSGIITANGERLIKSTAYINIAYIPKGDIVSDLSVYDTVRYAALLRRTDTHSAGVLGLINTPAPSSYSELHGSIDDLDDRVNKVIGIMGIRDIVDRSMRKAGTVSLVKQSSSSTNDTKSMDALSPSQLRCVTIACEIVNRPGLLFMEDPFYGLDWYSVEILKLAIERLTKGGRTVVCTVNKPTKSIFECFTDTILMGTGLMIFNGPTNEAVAYFASAGFEQRNQDNMEYLLDIATDRGSMKMIDGKRATILTHEDLADMCRSLRTITNTKASDTTDGAVAAPQSSSDVTASKAQKKQNTVQLIDDKTNIKASILPTAKVLLLRAFKSAWSDKHSVVLFFLRYIVAGFTVGSVWYHMKDGGFQERVSLLGTVYFALNVAIVDLFEGIHERKAMFLRESLSNASNFVSYWLTDSSPSQLFNVIGALVFCIPVYIMSGLRRGFAPFVYFYIMVLASTYCNLGLAYLLSTVTTSANASRMIFNGVLIPLQLLWSGNLILLSSMQPYYKWGSVINPMSYFVAGTFRNELHNNDSALGAVAYDSLSDLYDYHITETAAFFVLVLIGFLLRLAWLLVLQLLHHVLRQREIMQRMGNVRKRAKKIVTAGLRWNTSTSLGLNAHGLPTHVGLSVEDEFLAELHVSSAMHNTAAGSSSSHGI